MDNIELNEALLQQEIVKARAISVLINTMQPQAESAYYDINLNKIVINLKYGSTFSFSPNIAQGLTEASPTDLAEVEITPSGMGLHWEKLDADLSIPALLAGVYGNKDWMKKISISV